MAHERLQKALARAGVASRRRIEELIARRRVTVNGEIAQLGDKVDLEHDSVKVDGKRVQPLRRPQLYLLLNKPPGYVSTVNDPENRPTVLDLLPDRLHKALFPVGRLDYDSEGLLLMTTDGELAQKVAHPSSGCTKLYEVKVKGHPDGPALAKLSRGIVLDGRHAAPAWVESFGGPPGRRTGRDNSWFRVALKEGRTRQIREMFFRIGHPVMRLKRTQIGGLTDPFLRSGSWRELLPAEIEKLLTGEPAQRVERSRGRVKVKFEDMVEEAREAKARRVRPVRRRITAPLEEGEAAPKAKVSRKSSTIGKVASPVSPAAEPAPVAEPKGNKKYVSESFPRDRRPARGAEAGEKHRRGRVEGGPRGKSMEESAEEWGTRPAAREPVKPRPIEEDWAPARPARAEKRLFEESEFDARPARPSSFLYGDDDEEWDEPVEVPLSELPPRGAPGRSDRPARVGPRPGAQFAGDRSPSRPRGGAGSFGAGRPRGRGPASREGGAGGEWGTRPGGPSGRDAYGPRPSGDRPRGGRPSGDRPGGGYGGRPSRGPSRDGGYGDRPSGGYGDRPSRGPASREGGYGERPSGGYQKRPIGGYADRPSGGPPSREGGYGDRPSGARPSGGRPGGARPGGRPGGPTAGYGEDRGGRGPASRDGGGYGERAGGERPSGGRPGGGRPGGGRPSSGRPGGRPGGRPAAGDGRPARPSGGGGRPGGAFSGFADDRDKRPSRPGGASRPRNGAGRNTPPSGGRPSGGKGGGKPRGGRG